MINQQIGNYKFLSVLGEGGMAIVYLAQNTMLDSLIAIKVLKDEFVHNKNVRTRFLDEAKKMVKVKHPNIILVMDLIDLGEVVAIVMEYVEGKSLKDLIERNGKLDHETVESLLRQMLSALDHIHQLGYVHRDIKPSNFMLGKDGTIKLADFGIAKDNNVVGATETGTQMGTPLYMSPEQIKSTKDVDHRSDIYSLGVVLYEMVSGFYPFDKNTLSIPEIQVCILHDPFPLTHTFWDNYIIKATAKIEDERFQSCEEWEMNLFNEESLSLIKIEDDKTLIEHENYDLDENQLKKIKKTNNFLKDIIKNQSNKRNKIYNSVWFRLITIFLVLIIIFRRCYRDKNSNHQDETNSVEEIIFPDYIPYQKLNIDEGSESENPITGFENDDSFYKSIKIGNQIWMSENLNVSTFKNGDSIPEAKSDQDWVRAGKDGQPAWCYYNNNTKIGEKYGKLYNWFAVHDPRGLAPKGWHIPNGDEWNTLSNFLEGKENAGYKMKSVNGWNESGNGSNESKFSAIPAGNRNSNGSFENFGNFGFWWIKIENEHLDGYLQSLSKNDNKLTLSSYGGKARGISVRCVKN